jgi:hypothetical protein
MGRGAAPEPGGPAGDSAPTADAIAAATIHGIRTWGPALASHLVTGTRRRMIGSKEDVPAHRTSFASGSSWIRRRGSRMTTGASTAGPRPRSAPIVLPCRPRSRCSPERSLYPAVASEDVWLSSATPISPRLRSPFRVERFKELLLHRGGEAVPPLWMQLLAPFKRRLLD